MELVFNIWFIVDIGTNLCKYAILRPYNLSGNDDEKTELLKIMAETDYFTEERFDFAENNTIVLGSETIEGYIHASNINDFFDQNMDMFVTYMENKLPQKLSFKGDVLGENKAEKQLFPDNPLFVQTILMENEYGDMRPYTSFENKQWVEKEKERIDFKSKGFQN